MENIYSLRESTPADKQAVLQIHDNVYDGLDYLPEYYDHFQTSDNVTPYVYMENDKIIAYLAYCNLDTGETIVTRAGRVNPAYQGRHLYGRFKSEVEAIQKADGKTKRLALVKDTTPSESFLRSYKPKATKNVHLFEYKRSRVSEKTTNIASEICSRSKVLKNVSEEFLQPPYSNYLFPEDRIVVDCVPFRLLLTNIPLLKGIDTVFYSDIKASCTEIHDDLNKQTADTDRVQGLLSASTVFKAHHNFDIVCYLDIFGTDFSSLTDHILFHLQRINEFGKELVNFQVYTTKGTVDIALLHTTLEELGIHSIIKDSRKETFTELVVYEKEINKTTCSSKSK